MNSPFGLLHAGSGSIAPADFGRRYADSSDADMQPRPEAVGLLSQIVARLRGAAAPVIQLVPASRASPACSVAYELAVASATRFDRALLMSVQTERAGMKPRSARAGDGSDLVLPDANVPGLHHIFQSPPPRGGPDLSAFLIAPDAFEILIADCCSPLDSVATIDLACKCHGTIVTVAAGRTLPEELATTIRLLRTAGATLFGTVLHRARYARTV